MNHEFNEWRPTRNLVVVGGGRPRIESLPRGNDTAEKLYGALFAGDGGTRACADISEDACTDVPRNFFVHLFSQIFTKTGDALSSPRLVLSWLLAGLGVSPGIIGLVVPVREAGSLLPQLAIGSFVRRTPVRKWFWVAGSFAQGLTVAGIAVAALFLRGAAAGWTIVGLIALFSLARGVCSVTGKDLVGKTIPKRRRGRLSGLSASVVGIVAYALGTQTGAPVAAAKATPTGANPWIYAVLFFVLSLAHTGIRVARKTYLVDMASAEERASYVAVSNTVIGIVLLMSGSLGVLAAFLTSYEVILVFALLGLAGATVALTLGDVEQEQAPAK